MKRRVTHEKTLSKLSGSLLLVGAGKMGSVMLDGWLARGLAPKRIAVIDRDISLGFGGVLWGELRGLADPETVVQNYITGLGGGDVCPEHLENMLSDLYARAFADAPAMMEAL